MFSTVQQKTVNSKVNKGPNFRHIQRDASSFERHSSVAFNYGALGIRPKLKINQPNDKYEQEADRIADQVVNHKGSEIKETQGFNPVQRKPLVQEISAIRGAGVQRKCSQCEEDEEKMIQRKESSAAGYQVSNQFQSMLQSTKGDGRVMDKRTAAEMNSRFGLDFSSVRIHNDGNAAKMSQGINAKAFTIGNDIYFNRGEYKPQTKEGQRLLAHELVHTVQQGNSSISIPYIQRQIHDYIRTSESPCACLVHIHNDEKNSKAVARLLNSNCNYNLIDVRDTVANSRGLNRGLRILNHRGRPERKRDPNEIFSPEMIRNCDNPTERSAMRRRRLDIDEVCSIYEDLQDCSNYFSVPTVALHNNTMRGPTDSTNIRTWGRSRAIDETHEGDSSHLDRVIWTSNRQDYEVLERAGNFNVAFQDQNFDGDTDLSTLFNELPEIMVENSREGIQFISEIIAWLRVLITSEDQNVAEIASTLSRQIQTYLAHNQRYINIETEHVPNVYNQTLAEINLRFVHEVLSALGLWCCDGSIEDLLSRLREYREN